MAVALAAAVTACSSATGSGEVWSDHVFITECIDGPYDLSPSFFGANPFPRGDTMLIRVQRGEDFVDFSDGLLANVRGVSALAAAAEQAPFTVSLGLSEAAESAEDSAGGSDVPPVTLALYLDSSCHTANATLYSVGGTMTFRSLFNGDPNETDLDRLTTDATFEAEMADPRERLPDGTFPAGAVSHLSGWFRFVFRVGKPAQPFPS